MLRGHARNNKRHRPRRGFYEVGGQVQNWLLSPFRHSQGRRSSWQTKVTPRQTWQRRCVKNIVYTLCIRSIYTVYRGVVNSDQVVSKSYQVSE